MTVNISGHEVPERLVDLFFDGRTGRAITDAEWDEQKRRIAEAEALADDADITWQPIESGDAS